MSSLDRLIASFLYGFNCFVVFFMRKQLKNNFCFWQFYCATTNFKILMVRPHKLQLPHLTVQFIVLVNWILKLDHIIHLTMTLMR